MIPYLFAALGGYLIGQSTKSKLLDNAANGTIPDAGLEVAAASVLEKGGLIAPNGNQSNLTPEQYKLVRTPEFKSWFGDWENDPENASKVVDENGEPLVVYHGTNEKFTKFSKSFSRGKKKQLGIYLSDNPEVAKLYGDKILECFVSIKDPFIKNYEGENYWNLYGSSDLEVSAQFNRAKAKITNADGVIFLNIKDSLERFTNAEIGNNYIPFNSNQIKLADGTNTTFDGSNPDIRYNMGGKLIPRYVVSVYKDGEYEIYEAESYAEAKRLATQGEHAEIYDTKLKKNIE